MRRKLNNIQGTKTVIDYMSMTSGKVGKNEFNKKVKSTKNTKLPVKDGMFNSMQIVFTKRNKPFLRWTEIHIVNM